MRKELLKVVSDCNEKFGFNALRPASELDDSIFRTPSGSISLDISLGAGIPAGRLVGIAGAYSAAKSAVAYHIIKQTQNMYKKEVIWEKYSTDKKPVMREVICDKNDKGAEPLTCALIQSESHSFTKEWAQKIGIDIENLIVVYPKSMEEALDIAIALQKAGIDLIVHDSYTAYTPEKVQEKEQTDSVQMGIKPQRFQEYHGKFQAENNYKDRNGKLPTTVVALHQLREAIGKMYGPTEFISGGRSIGYTEAVEVRLRKGDQIFLGAKSNPTFIGHTIKFKVEKNKTYKPYMTGEFDFYYADGGVVGAGQIDNAKELIIEAILCNILEMRGSWLYYEGVQIAQGKDAGIEKIRGDKKLFAEIKAKVMEKAFNIERPDVFETTEVQDDDEEFNIPVNAPVIPVIPRTKRGKK